ncbi:hypothetical protein [Streptomyces rubellomurinus]|uniref:Uncharacterized protein n=1 Tax=Streptomyces rubellomurinus (strain ATCC 31215) TaxID=359131 RepID=A0A0F2T8W1_STRR3|nr:hypothetical protein [Streptomyces rubellomurinus]KJS59633.1 hypothetical protein VM95_26195 [Streptomyces rubellomurinus]
MGSRLVRETEEIRREAAMVFDDLQAVLAAVGVKLPSLRVDWASVKTTGVVVIQLGAAAPREVAGLVEVLRKGARA